MSLDPVTRARSAIAQGVQYALGRGGYRPDHPFPWSAMLDAKLCDCSGFAAWCLGVSRQNPDPRMPWLETTAVAHDANGPCVLFKHVPWEQAAPGDVLVWGDHDQHQGHIGIVATVDANGPLTVVHCSLGNFNHTGDAIRETSPDIFRLNGAIAAQFTGTPAVGAADAPIV